MFDKIRLSQNAYFEFGTILCAFPKIAYLCYYLNSGTRPFLVRKHTDLVIEGFPRSATTFSYYAFCMAQRRRVHVAFHLHSPVNVVNALRMKVPVLVILRPPRDAVSSAFVRDPQISLKANLRRYDAFYRLLTPYKNDIVVADFKDVVRDFGQFVERINKKFDKNYLRPTNHPLDLEKIRDGLVLRNQHGTQLTSYLPNDEKENLKRQVDFRSCRTELRRCEDLYHQWIHSGPGSL